MIDPEELNGTNFEDGPVIEQQPRKKTWKRKPWVYRSEYDALQRRAKLYFCFGLLGWIAFLVALKFATL